MAARRPAGRLTHKSGVVHGSNVDCGSDRILRMAPQAQVGIGIDEQFAIDRAMRVVTSDATFAQSFVLEYHGPGLFAVALRAAFVHSRHGQPSGRFENIAAVGIVALHAIHMAFNYRMVLGQVEFRVDFEMTLKAGGGILAGIHNKFSPTASRLDMKAAWPMTGFTTALAGRGGRFVVNAGVGPHGKAAHVTGMTIGTGLVPDVMGARNFGRHVHRPGNAGTGIDK